MCHRCNVSTCIACSRSEVISLDTLRVFFEGNNFRITDIGEDCGYQCLVVTLKEGRRQNFLFIAQCCAGEGKIGARYGEYVCCKCRRDAANDQPSIRFRRDWMVDELHKFAVKRSVFSGVTKNTISQDLLAIENGVASSGRG